MQGKVVIVTGGAQGIGNATARIFAAEGASVVLADVDYVAAQSAATQIAGRRALALECDVGRADSVQECVDKVLHLFGRIDILHANAAVQINKDIGDLTEQDWDQMQNVNLKGVFLTCKSVISVMRSQKKGVIVISSSGHAFATYPKCSAYAATKGGELALMRGLALDGARDGIRVNCVIPGATDTRLVKTYLESSPDPVAARQKLLDSIPLGRLANPEEIARAVLFLASDFAAYITGASLAVDGGLLAQA
jgi:NAD(P)-dependent dehydrogenase (short-subunit alcohol dehydrogenase family)